MAELWSIAEVGDYLRCEQSDARALLAGQGIDPVSGYPAEQVRQIRARLGDQAGQGTPLELEPIQDAVLRQLGLAGNWTTGRIAQAIDPAADASVPVAGALQYLLHLGYIRPGAADSWHLTQEGHEVLAQLYAYDARFSRRHDRQGDCSHLVLREARGIHGSVKRFLVNYPPDEHHTAQLFAEFVALPEIGISSTSSRFSVDIYLKVLRNFGESQHGKLAAIFEKHANVEGGHVLRSPVSIIIFELLENSHRTFEDGVERFSTLTEQDLEFLQSAWGAQ